MYRAPVVTDRGIDNLPGRTVAREPRKRGAAHRKVARSHRLEPNGPPRSMLSQTVSRARRAGRPIDPPPYLQPIATRTVVLGSAARPNSTGGHDLTPGRAQRPRRLLKASRTRGCPGARCGGSIVAESRSTTPSASETPPATNTTRKATTSQRALCSFHAARYAPVMSESRQLLTPRLAGTAEGQPRLSVHAAQNVTRILKIDACRLRVCGASRRRTPTPSR